MNKTTAIKGMLNKITSGKWESYGTDEGHEILMGTALDYNRSGHEVQHKIEYDHGLFMDDGEQYDEAEANVKFIAAAPGAIRFLLEENDKNQVLNRELA